MNTPTDLVAVPPLARTIIYYSLGTALVVCMVMASGAEGWRRAQDMVTGWGVLWLGTAAAKVNAARAAGRDGEAPLEEGPA